MTDGSNNHMDAQEITWKESDSQTVMHRENTSLINPLPLTFKSERVQSKRNNV